MANAKKCDRCGKFYLGNQAERNGHVTRGVAFIGLHNGFTWGYKDLCDECQDKLDEFLNGGEVVKAYIKNCDNCKFSGRPGNEYPCCDCNSRYNKGEPKEDNDEAVNDY